MLRGLTGKWEFEAQLTRQAIQVQELSWIYPKALNNAAFSEFKGNDQNHDYIGLRHHRVKGLFR